MRRLFDLTAALAAALLLACPLRNLQNLRECFGLPDVVMDVPASQIRFEAGLLMLQVGVAALAGMALHLGARARPALRLGAGVAWTLVALGGFAWDKALDTFAGQTLSPNSAFGCLLDARSAHTHTVLTNAPFVLAVGLAFGTFWRLRADRQSPGPAERAG
jgi:hypothetical protein